MSTMHLDIVSLEKQICSCDVRAVFATGGEGELGIYPGHTQLLSTLKSGYIRVVREDNEEDVYFVSGGLLEVQPKSVTVLADMIIRAADIDEVAAKEAKDRAEKLLAAKRSDFEFGKAQAELANAVAQLRALQQLRKRHQI